MGVLSYEPTEFESKRLDIITKAKNIRIKQDLTWYDSNKLEKISKSVESIEHNNCDFKIKANSGKEVLINDFAIIHNEDYFELIF